MSNKENIIYNKFLDPELFLDKSAKIIEDYICPLCKGVLNYPSMLKNSDKITCKNCLIKEKKIGKLEEKNIISINTIFEILEKQKLNCKNKCIGCEFEGNLKEYRKHILNNCNYEMINCPLEGCEEKIFRIYLEDHISLCDHRIIKCPKCEKIMKYKEIIEHKKSFCEEEEIVCPNKCGNFIKRKLIDEHLKINCDNIIVNCPYNKFGCRYPSKMRKEIRRHMKDALEEHNELLLIYINDKEDENKKKMEELENKIVLLENNVKNYCFIQKKRKRKNGKKKSNKINKVNNNKKNNINNGNINNNRNNNNNDDDDEINLDNFDFEKYFIDNDEIKNNNKINKDINYNKNKKYKDDSPISLNESIFL
jgi:hypothetical protein